MKLARRAVDAPPFHAMSIGARAQELEAAGHRIAKLSLGEPSFGAPPAVREAMREAMDGRPLPYTPAIGLPALREAIAGLYLNPNQVVVTNKSGIRSLADVKGKHFAVASAGSSVYNEAKAHFTAAGLNFPGDFKAEYIAFGGAADMLQNGTLDGAWIMSGAPASAVSQALTADCRLLPIGDDVFAKLKAQYPWYVKYTSPAGTYPNPKEAVQTTAIKMLMFCRGDLSEDTVYQLTKSFWEHIDELGKSQKNLKGLKPADAVKDIADVPLHPGAVKYYKEIGVLK